jgi:hypothetical protein
MRYTLKKKHDNIDLTRSYMGGAMLFMMNKKAEASKQQ